MSQENHVGDDSSWDAIVRRALYPDSRFSLEFDPTTPRPESKIPEIAETTLEGSTTSASSTQCGHDNDVEKAEEILPPQPEPMIQQKDPNLVEWNGPDDPDNAQNWSKAKKWVITMSLAAMTLTVAFTSSVLSSATFVVSSEFNVDTHVGILGTSLFVLGFTFGPIAWGPLSEVYGRMTPLFSCYAAFAIFMIPVAVAQNIQTILICRFLGGVFGSAPLVIVAGAFADIWNPVDRGIAVSIFASATFVGPVSGPIVGGFVTQSHLGWRWTAWLTLIMAATSGGIGMLVVPETYAGTILQRRAARLRHETKNWALHAKLDEQRVTTSDLFTRYFYRPFQMLIQEPILLLITIYISLIYGILYLFFEAYPISFQMERGWNMGVGALPFLGIIVGVLMGAVVVSWVTQTRFARKCKEHGRVIPEERLPPMILGSFLLPIGLFWFAWTSDKDITWVPQVIAGVPIGMGIFMIFLQGLNYLIDVYLMFANSAMSANTIVRSVSGAAFPLFATEMYHTMGVNWATSLLGFLTAAMIPVPILFYIYGKKIRAMSKFAPKF
jgi:MFS transporter, DHA1 family, multidrug resistance protein